MVMVMNKLDIASIFKSDADDILKARVDSIRIHGSNIRAAGNEVEESIRNYLSRMLPPRYFVSQGHLIDRNGKTSPQLDVIISDNFNIPSLMTTKDGTRYIPIDSVYAVGEIKSTYYKSDKPIEKFIKTIIDVKENLYHEDIVNTVFKGLTNHSLLRDIVLGKKNMVLNRIFFFEFFVDGGNFDLKDVSKLFNEEKIKYLPNIVVILNKGFLLRATIHEESININRYPEDVLNDEDEWYFSPFQGSGNGSLEGNHLGILYNFLIEHLSNSYLEPPTLNYFLSDFMIGRKSQLKKISEYL